jgi:hypothetical protein
MLNYVLIAEAVEVTGYTPRHIALLLREGHVQGKKVGRIWLVDLDDLKRHQQKMNELGTKKFDPTRGDTT